MENVNNNGFDPLMWANLDENKNEKNVEQKLMSSTVDHCVNDTDTEINKVASIIIERGIDITEGYNKWRDLGFALSDELGEGGRSLYHDLSRMNSSYNYAECDKQYTKCIKAHGSGIHIATFFQMAKDAGVDLSEVGRQQQREALSASCANPPSANRKEYIGKSTIMGDFDDDVADGGLADVADSHQTESNAYTFSDKLNPEDMDYISHTIYEIHNDEPAKCDAMLLGGYNIISGLMGGANMIGDKYSGVYGIYDGRRVGASLYNIIYSGAGNDKGNLVFCKKLAQPVKNEMRKKYEEELQGYEAEKAAWEAKGKKDRGEAPKEPIYRDPFVPGNSSSSSVYRSLDANGGWGLMFETEADTVSSMVDSDYGNYSDLMRKAHHHEPISMNRVTDKIHIDIEVPRLSVLLTCTPGQLPALFPSFENGLGSRFLFYNIPDTDVRFHDVFALKDTPLEDEYKKLGEELLPLYHALQQRVDHPIQFVMSQEQQHMFLKEYQEMLQEQFAMLGKGIRAFVFRIALECFRYAMILTTLRRFTEWKKTFDIHSPQGIFREEENALVCDDRDFNAAMSIIRCLIYHTARVYAVMSKEDNNPFAQRGIKLNRDELKLYKALPEGEFRTSVFLDVAGKLEIPERTAQRMLSQFSNVYRIITPVRKGIYRKPITSGDNHDVNPSKV